MTPEEMQRTMEFIVEQQAKFSTDIQKLFESDDRLREQQATLTGALIRIAKIVEENHKESDRRFADLVESQKATDRRVAELAEAQKATEESLNALVHIVEDHVVRRRNGKKRRK
jgi:hypothetical protein